MYLRINKVTYVNSLTVYVFQALFILILPTAPSQPQALRVTFMNATTVSVVWEPPLFPNGIILNYTVDIVPQNPRSLPYITSVSADTSETVGGLEPATTYQLTVAGTTSAGTGKAATVIVTTLPCECQQ